MKILRENTGKENKEEKKCKERSKGNIKNGFEVKKLLPYAYFKIIYIIIFYRYFKIIYIIIIR